MRDDRGQPRQRRWTPEDPRFRRYRRTLEDQAGEQFLFFMLKGFVVTSRAFVLGSSIDIISGYATTFLWLAYEYMRWEKSYSKKIAGRLKRDVLCPACLEDLSALHPDPDGCTVCTECGAAWRLPDSQDA